MEKFDLYNQAGNKLNKQMIRGEKNLNGEYHRVVHVWIRHSNQKYLIQQRNKASDNFPYQWAPTAGAVQAGESSLQASIRETKEEIGIDLLESDLRFLKSIFIEEENHNYIIDLYLARIDINLKDLVLEKREVKDVKLASKDDIMKMLKEKKFWDFNSIDIRIDYFNQLEMSQL